MNPKYSQKTHLCVSGMAAVCIFSAMGLHGYADPASAGANSPAAMTSVAAASALPIQYSVNDKSGTIAWLSGEFQPAAPGDFVESAYKFLEGHRQAFQVQSPRSEFALMMTRQDKGHAGDHVYLEQKINGLPVWGRRLGFHFNSQGKLYAVNGNYCAAPSAGKLTVQPLIGADQAMGLALTNVRISAGKFPASVAPFSAADKDLAMTLNRQAPQTAELMYYPDTQGALRLSYKVNFSFTSPPGDWIYFVDALSGAILFRMNNIQTSGAAVGSGLDLFNNTISLNTYLDTDSKYKLVNTTKNMFSRHSTHSNTTWQGCIEIRDCEHKESGGSPTSADNNPVVYDPDGDNVFTYGGSDYRNNYQSAVQLAKFISDTYDFFGNMWGRDSLDDQGVSMIGNIHLGTKYDNSMWSPVSKMTFFGDSSDDYWPEARSLDTVTHEETHGVTTYAVPPDGYIYIIESGAINESLSDIGAVTHDYKNWNYGEDYHKDGTASRRFDDPTAVAQPQPKDMYDFYLMPLQVDNGGVHYNSGIGNHFFYQFAMKLPAESPASDGRFAASKITYRSYAYGAANPLATFREWGQYVKQACIDLYGPGDTFNKLVEAMDYVHIPQALIAGYDNWQFKLDNTGKPYFFALQRIGYPCWPVVSVRFTRPRTDARVKTVAINLENLDPTGNFNIWYIASNADGSPDESTAQKLFSNVSPSVIRTDNLFNNFKLTDSISVAGDFHICLDLCAGYYLGIRYDTGDPAAGRSWVKYYDSWGYPQWSKSTDTNNLMIKVIYETTPSNAPAAPTLGSPANGATVDTYEVPFSWNSVSGADRYFLEVNSSSSWAESNRVFFATVTNTSQTTSGFPVGVNYWRVWAGNADAWSTASETRSFTETVAPPTLACSVTSMSANAVQNQGSFSQSFTVWNSGNGTVTYSITEDADWLSVCPTNGTSTGESGAIQVTYNPSALSTGVHSGTITVSASGAFGSPKTIPVTLTVIEMAPLAADFDGDLKADPAVVMSGKWYVWLSSCNYYRVGPCSFSETCWTPAVGGDFDGDRLADPGGMDATGKWYLYFSRSMYMRGGGYPLGDPAYEPLIADFDGDGYADTAGVDCSGNWLIWMSAYYYLRAGPIAFGGAGWLPRAGDFDGDRFADPAAVDCSGNWYIWLSSARYLRAGPCAFGASGLLPVAGDFDGDRRSDTAGTDGSGAWYFWLSSAGYHRIGPVTLTMP